MMIPRDYQERELQNLYNYVLKNPDKNPLVEACVGSGKSAMIAWFMDRMLRVPLFKHLKFLCLVHTQELVGQNLEEFRGISPNTHSSLFMGTLGKLDHTGQVVYGSIQSVSGKEELFCPNIIIVDECHFITKRAEKGRYRKFIQAMKEKNPGLIVIGFTGTPWRMDGGALIHGEESLFDEITGRVTIRELLDLGYLAPLRPPLTEVQNKFDTSSIAHKDKNNETKAAQILDASQDKIDNAIDEYYRLSQGRKKHLIFGTTIDHCEHICKSAKRYFKCEFIHGKLTKKIRQKHIKDFKDGKLDMLISGIILTTGFNVPSIDSIGNMRLTTSSALYTQMAGRGLRIAPGKVDCLWIDFTETTEILGPVDEIEPPPPPVPGMALVKTCPICEKMNIPAATKRCPNCDHEWIFEENEHEEGFNHEEKASLARVLSTDVIPPMWVDVEDAKWDVKHKWSKPDEKHIIVTVIPKGLKQKMYKFYMDFDAQGYNKNMACYLWSVFSVDQYKDMCPDNLGTAVNLIKNGVFQPFSRMLVDINGVKTHRNAKGSGRKTKNDFIMGAKLLKIE